MSAGGVSGYAVVHARVRAMYAAMLTPEVWARLYEANDLGAVLNMLKETVYGPCLAAVGDRALSPRRAVYQIKGHLASACTTVISLAPEHARPLLTQLYRLFEVDNLKAVLRGIAAGASWDEVRFVLFPLGSFTVLPAQEMVESESIAAAVERLRGTVYYGTLSHAMERYTAEQSLFPLEVALDLDYWRELWDDVNRMPGQDRDHARRLVGSLVDMNNLMWAIRYRVYHHLSEEEIINYTLPFGGQVRDENIRAIAAGADIAQVIGRIYPELADVSSMLQEPRNGLQQFECLLQQRVVRQCRSAFVGYPFHVGVPIAYVLLNEFEIQDLTMLIEAKALHMPVERFRSYMLMECAVELG